MKEISIDDLEEKIKVGESIEKIAEKYRVCFALTKSYIPRTIPVETLIEIVDKVPELLTTDRNIPFWVFLLLLVRERFDIVDKIVSEIFKKEKQIEEDKKEEDTSNIIVCNTLSTIKQVTKEQISVLLSIMKKRKKLLSKSHKEYNAQYLIYYFLEPISNYLSEECFLPIFNWANKETDPYFFKYITSHFFEKLPLNSRVIQKNLVKYFISVSASWLASHKLNKLDFFMNWDKVKLLDEAFFVSSVVKFFSRLHNFKKVYLLNFSYFIENYPLRAVNSLKDFVYYTGSRDFIIRDDKIFIPNKIWDILSKKEPLLFLDLIKNLPDNQFFFDVDYVSDKAKLLCFVYPENSEEVQTRLKKLKEVVSEAFE